MRGITMPIMLTAFNTSMYIAEHTTTCMDDTHRDLLRLAKVQLQL